MDSKRLLLSDCNTRVELLIWQDKESGLYCGSYFCDDNLRWGGREQTADGLLDNFALNLDR